MIFPIGSYGACISPLVTDTVGTCTFGPAIVNNRLRPPHSGCASPLKQPRWVSPYSNNPVAMPDNLSACLALQRCCTASARPGSGRYLYLRDADWPCIPQRGREQRKQRLRHEHRSEHAVSVFAFSPTGAGSTGQ